MNFLNYVDFSKEEEMYSKLKGIYNRIIVIIHTHTHTHIYIYIHYQELIIVVRESIQCSIEMCKMSA